MSNKIMKITMPLFLFLILCGCATKSSLVQVTSAVKFGSYSINPPKGYWYYPREVPASFVSKIDFFLLTFWPDKTIPTKSNPIIPKNYYNLSVTMPFNNFESYYDEAEGVNVSYFDLEGEINSHLAIEGWSCKATTIDLTGIECITIKNELITVSLFGSKKENVTSNISQLKKMLLSLKTTNSGRTKLSN